MLQKQHKFLTHLSASNYVLYDSNKLTNKMQQFHKSSLSFFSCGAETQRRSWPPHSWDFLDHTRRRTTVGRTSLDERSARRRDLYLTTHNTHNRQTSMPPVRFEPTISAGEWPQTYALDRAATGTGFTYLLLDVYVWLNMFRALPRPSSGAYNCISSLWFYRRSVAVAVLLVMVWQVISFQTMTNNAATVTLQR